MIACTAEKLEGNRISVTRPKTKRRIIIALSVLGALVVIVAAFFGGSYLWFSAKVHNANARVDTATQDALATKPPSTLVSIPQASGSPTPANSANPPLDIILLGSDARGATVESPGSSDVIMLLHVDRDRNFLSILSVPRDLYVDIPGHSKDRINAAYYLGGPALTIGTIKQTLGVDVTKYLEVGFKSFENMIDSLGGVYIDVDRTYTQEPRWAGNFSPGYQLLDGADALLFARYRFDQNSDFGRMARQQHILSAIRDQAMNWNLPTKMPGLIDGLLGSAITNLSADEMLKLSYWLVKLDGGRIKQTMIRGPGQMIDGKAVLVVDQSTLKEAVTAYLTPPDEQATQAGDNLLLTAIGSQNLLTTDSTVTTPATLPDAGMWKTAQMSVPFALQAPGFLPEGFAYAYKMPEGEGTYGIKVGNGTMPAVRMGYRYQTTDLYLGITATTWTDAPLARDGTEVESNGVVYTIVGTSGKADHIWWTRDGVLYFISNTLMDTLGKQDLLRMAESMTPVGVAGQ